MDNTAFVKTEYLGGDATKFTLTYQPELTPFQQQYMTDAAPYFEGYINKSADSLNQIAYDSKSPLSAYRARDEESGVTTSERNMSLTKNAVKAVFKTVVANTVDENRKPQVKDITTDIESGISSARHMEQISHDLGLGGTLSYIALNLLVRQDRFVALAIQELANKEGGIEVFMEKYGNFLKYVNDLYLNNRDPKTIDYEDSENKGPLYSIMFASPFNLVWDSKTGSRRKSLAA